MGLAFTAAIVYLIPNRLPVVFLLVFFWALLFFPFTAAELVAFVLAAAFFVLQNYVCLKAGLFEFRFKDILLMPYYEPLLWGFYFLSMKRFISGNGRNDLLVNWKSVAGLAVTSLVFSAFSYDSHALFIATGCSTTFLFVMFHTRRDVQYALYALGLGLAVELFGVSTGLWLYPSPDFLGIPYWFATMWISVGLVGRRFLFPSAEWLGARIVGHRA